MAQLLWIFAPERPCLPTCTPDSVFLCGSKVRRWVFNQDAREIKLPSGSKGQRHPMKALVKSKAERGLWLEDIPEPTIGINDVLIRVRYTGICGTDVHI